MTLTYSDENLPLNDNGVPTLRRLDFDGYMKRLRSYYDECIRFLGSGEYSAAGRPHYHLCLFGIGVDDIVSRTSHYHHNSSGIFLEDFQGWLKGGSFIQPFDVKTSFYVSKYLIKSSRSVSDYDFLGIEPEFVSQSRRPALGKTYAINHRERLLKDGFIRCKGVKFPIPRYFMDKILNDGSDAYQDLKQRLFERANDGLGRYNKGLSAQFGKSGIHFFEQCKLESSSRERILMKGN